MRKTIAIIIALSMGLAAVAQQLMTSRQMPDMHSSVVRHAPQADGDLVPWGYCESDVQFAIGVNERTELSAAILISKDVLGIYRNADIMGIRFGVADDAEGVSVFIKTGDAGNLSFDLPNSREEYVGTVGVGFHDVVFDSPFRTTDEYLIVGYTGVGENFIGFDGGVTNADACYLCLNDEWGTLYDQAVSNAWGSLSIQLLLGGAGMPDIELSMTDIITSYVEQNHPFTLQGVVTNLTTTPVTEYEITYSANNGQQQTERFECNISSQETDTFAIDMPAFVRVGSNSVMVRIATVNGIEDGDASNNTMVGSINCIEEGCFFLRKMVMEESTSVYCGYCPKGIMIMRSLNERYPDRFIGISIHSASMGPDPMCVYDYDEDINYLYTDDGLPNSILNRKREYSGDPIYMDMYFESEMKYHPIAVADVRLVSVSRVNDRQIAVDVQTKFADDISGANYKLAFVVLENNVASAVAQLNYFSGGSPMGGFESLPREIDMRHNDVARGVWDFRGIEGSVPSDIVKKEVYDYSYTIDLDSKNALVQDESALEVVVMLLDPVTDEILNADKKAVGYATGIVVPPVPNDDVQVCGGDGYVQVVGGCDGLAVYDMSGIQLANENLTRGLYIAVVEKDGIKSVHKVLVK